MKKKSKMIRLQRRIAARILKCGENKIKFDSDAIDYIKEAITKNDIRSLINKGTVSRKRSLSTSKFWSRKRKKQKQGGGQKGYGSRKGKKTARTKPKRTWMNKIRLQRNFIKSLRDDKRITQTAYHELYAKSKGGFFRSLRHLTLYTKERGLLNNEKQKSL